MSNRYQNRDSNPNSDNPKEGKMAKKGGDDSFKETPKTVNTKAKFRETPNPNDSVPVLPQQKGVAE